MADSLVYLYAVGDAVLGENTPTELTGVEGTPLRRPACGPPAGRTPGFRS